MHFGTFPILKGTPDELRAALKKQKVTAKVVGVPQRHRASRFSTLKIRSQRWDPRPRLSELALLQLTSTTQIAGQPLQPGTQRRESVPAGTRTWARASNSISPDIGRAACGWSSAPRR